MTNAPEPSLRERALGAYLGLAVGDALGATVEFLTPSEIRHQYGELRDIVGGGWLRLRAGQITDDTQMSLALGAAILESGGWDLKNIAEHWLAWLKSKPIDVGNTCRRGLQRFASDGSLESPFSDGDAGNGALMRVLPAILFAFRDADRLDRCVIEQAHVTHNHPLSDAATLCFAHMLADLLAGGHWRDNLAKLRAHAKALVAAHRQFRFDPYPGRATGYVVDTVQTVLHAFFATDSFESCLVATVNCGGDADTTGAIAGMLAGAHFGVAAIPARWLKRLDGAVLREVERQAPALLALQGA
ncbi:ADP-ribosyl-[dinitrogen reductase] hydrolase [Aromatoleum evansii]|uniref:ADP-ribosyl-[dinitrogen reductase] hydrolase n=1 Tax=Aromatoleum evansii TaxID=59406 RepID=UPI00145D656F|nr:ADP-ribosyl-[dinitrogen reductase] hydrolase [Aromatoleum evansii]NMG30836.1 ADP-ribosyl-[dinitrogen reductase] hydrolase [Aromatoleum evansii]